MTLVVVSKITRRLTGKERQILAQRLEGCYQREIAENIQVRDRYAVRRRLRRIREKTAQYLHE